jgi:uncharacterized protein YhaN
MGVIRELMVMTAAAYVERARDWSTRLEDKEAERSGVNLSEARKVVAREIGASPGTLENLRNRRVKGIAAHIYDRLRARVIRELESEMRHLEHELQILKQTGVGPSDGETEAVVAGLAKVREALGLPPGGGA